MMNHITLEFCSVGGRRHRRAAHDADDISDKRTALTAAFVSRFSIGFLTANTILPSINRRRRIIGLCSASLMPSSPKPMHRS